MFESGGHPASFMILLKLYDEVRPEPTSWTLALQKNLWIYMNGTHRKVKLQLQTMSIDEKSYVRELTTNAASPWDANLDETINKFLLAVGITLRVGQSSIRFTSCIMLRLCVDTLWPRPTDRLLVEDISPFDPIKLLTYCLPHFSPPVIKHILVQNKDGPAEASFHAALYSV
jgi:hypothetical protein